eukprot:scaffold1075_cov98-Skeletonema_marinoi.AAC.2
MKRFVLLLVQCSQPNYVCSASPMIPSLSIQAIEAKKWKMLGSERPALDGVSVVSHRAYLLPCRVDGSPLLPNSEGFRMTAETNNNQCDDMTKCRVNLPIRRRLSFTSSIVA